MKRRLDISKSEMLQLREQGLSNRDIAKCLEISVQTVRNYIGAQRRRMDNLAAFDTPKIKPPEQQIQGNAQPPRAVDKLEVAYEIVKSADGTFDASLDYESKTLSLCNSSIAFDKLPELVTFVVGLAARVNSR